jgi:hypothetical protein
MAHAATTSQLSTPSTHTHIDKTTLDYEYDRANAENKIVYEKSPQKHSTVKRKWLL